MKIYCTLTKTINVCELLSDKVSGYELGTIATNQMRKQQ